jgi:hypothetical protein
MGHALAAERVQERDVRERVGQQRRVAERLRESERRPRVDLGGGDGA